MHQESYTPHEIPLPICIEQIRVSIPSTMPQSQNFSLRVTWMNFMLYFPVIEPLVNFTRFLCVTFSRESISNIILNVDHIREVMSTQKQTDVFAKERASICLWVVVSRGKNQFLYFPHLCFSVLFENICFWYTEVSFPDINPSFKNLVFFLK